VHGSRPAYAINQLILQLQGVGVISAPGSEDDDVCLQLTPVVETYRIIREPLDLWSAFQLDFPVCDELAGPCVYARQSERVVVEGG
jgi:hypothetical protein